jgi:PHD/YefM family antitoxin component YafN of YafNO toxin-antitoxin module
MTTNLPLASSSEVSKRFGYYYDEAMTHPVGIERNGAARVVMLSMPEYQRLALLDHVATASSEMPDEDHKALRDARVSQESVDLNALMDETGRG